MSVIAIGSVSTQRGADGQRWKVPSVLASLQFMLILDSTIG
jgi:hypothetical protein